MYSQTEENYLKALFNLAIEKGAVTINELSKHLDIKMPTVNSMMKKLSDKKLIHYEIYKPVKLTREGEKQAALIIRKHRLTEMYLVEKMGFGWEGVHGIAEQVEHIQSPEFFDKMDEMLGFPKVDPHGSPIPDKEGRMDWIVYEKLSDCTPGEQVTLCAVTQASDEFLSFLNSRNLQLGSVLRVEIVEVYDGSMTVSYAERKSQVLSRMVCEKLLIKKL